MNILLVDDSPTVRTLVKFSLSSKGYNIFEAGDAEEALNVIKEKGPFPICIFDINMPGKNGIELIKEVLAIPEHANTKIVVLTTESSDELKQKGKEAGAKAWLVKPFEEESLLTVINKLASM